MLAIDIAACTLTISLRSSSTGAIFARSSDGDGRSACVGRWLGGLMVGWVDDHSSMGADSLMS